MDERPVRVIVVTDGDAVARQAVELAAAHLGLRTVSRSAGNPTRLSGAALSALCQQAPYDPVVLMVDDRGRPGLGPGEEALLELFCDPAIAILGVVAVAANTQGAGGITVDRSVAASGNVVPHPVNKRGTPRPRHQLLVGDTVEVLAELPVPVVVGIGDLGKGPDGLDKGAPLTRRALEEVLRYHNLKPPCGPGRCGPQGSGRVEPK
ncbi:MAG: stage V sporulation protein AE [Firmicutes bacterium]|nr:stage V sporulation protein AE [Bacillota bacterium]